MLNNVDLNDAAEASVAASVLEAMLIPRPTTTPPFPTRTTTTTTPSMNASSTTKMPSTTTVTSTTTTTMAKSADDLAKLVKDQLSIQKVMSGMLNVETVTYGSSPQEVELRLPLLIVAGKLLAGDAENVEKWDAVGKVPHHEGASRTLNQLHSYVLAHLSSMNISSTDRTDSFSPSTGTMSYSTSGEDFVMSMSKMTSQTLRSNVRIHFPNYAGHEWTANYKKFGNPKDEFSIPTGMFKSQPDCADKPVSVVTTILNQYGKVAPKRRNPGHIRSENWSVDSKVFAANVQISPDSLDGDVDVVKDCYPDLEFMKWNPLRGKFYHKTAGPARYTDSNIGRKLLSTWYSDLVRNGIEKRHCAHWNENFGNNGAWDTTGCVMTSTGSEYTVCECSDWGAMGVIVELTVTPPVEEDCHFWVFIKHIGFVVSAVLLGIFIVVTLLSKYVWNMFNVLRMHFCISWLGAITFNFLTDLPQFREDETSNILVGFAMVYFYAAALSWMTCEIHSIFKSFTSGIIGGRTKVYFPFGYGSPLIIIGYFFIFHQDELSSDPRCFIAWDSSIKAIYFYYLFGVLALADIWTLIIFMNIRRPQTKTKREVKDLKAQAFGVSFVAVFLTLFWILGYLAYVLKTIEGLNLPIDLFCIFSICNGWMGVIMFLFLGLGSPRFRMGFRGEAQKRKRMMENYANKAIKK